MLLAELGVNFILGQLRCGPGMAVHIGADITLIVLMRDGFRILVTQHLVNGLTRLDVAVQTVWDSFIQEIGCLTVKRFAVGKYSSGGQIMPGNNLRIIVTAGTDFSNVFGISDLMQSGGYVIIKPVDKFIGFVAHPAPA